MDSSNPINLPEYLQGTLKMHVLAHAAHQKTAQNLAGLAVQLIQQIEGFAKQVSSWEVSQGLATNCTTNELRDNIMRCNGLKSVFDIVLTCAVLKQMHGNLELKTLFDASQQSNQTKLFLAKQKLFVSVSPKAENLIKLAIDADCNPNNAINVPMLLYAFYGSEMTKFSVSAPPEKLKAGKLIYLNPNARAETDLKCAYNAQNCEILADKQLGFKPYLDILNFKK